MRLVSALLLATSLCLPALADSPDPQSAATDAKMASPDHESGLYRFGGTYEFTNTESADACAALCDTRAACFAWSYVAGHDAGESRCELKRSAGKVEYNPRATSGISSGHQDRFQPKLTLQDELAGGSDIASPPSDKPEPLSADTPA